MNEKELAMYSRALDAVLILLALATDVSGKSREQVLAEIPYAERRTDELLEKVK